MNKMYQIQFFYYPFFQIIVNFANKSIHSNKFILYFNQPHFPSISHNLQVLSMKFEVAFIKEKLKSIDFTLQIIVNLLKIKVIPHEVLFVYVAPQNQIRILIHRDQSPIIIVFENSLFTDLKSSSKHSNSIDKTLCTIGFIIKNGAQLLESLLSICRQEIKVVSSEQEKMIRMRIQKDRQFRFLQIKTIQRNIRLEIEKPKTNENQLFSYAWIDGVRKHSAYFQLNPAHFLQVLNPVWRYQCVHPFQSLPDKFVKVKLQLQRKILTASVKTMTSEIISKSFLTSHVPQEALDNETVMVIEQNNLPGEIKRENPSEKGHIIHYKIKFSDCQQIASLLKGQTSFIVDEQNRLVLHLNHEGAFQCQILLSDWIQFVKCEKEDGYYYKVEQTQQQMMIKHNDQQ